MPGDANPKVLAVEDNPYYAFLLREVFRLRGMPYIVVNTSGEALEQLKNRGAISVVLTDIGLPDISGIELCRKIKNDPELKSLPVLITTATHASQAGIEQECKQAGCDFFMVKPDDPHELLKHIERFLAK